MNIRTKRIYEPYAESDGYRILVDRLWPRAVKKERAGVNLWLKEVGPSNELRKWFNHEPEKWNEFLKRYKAELKTSAAFRQLTALGLAHKTITLVYSAKNEEHNQAIALKRFME